MAYIIFKEIGEKMVVVIFKTRYSNLIVRHLI